ncbi:hypothetical protein APHAL10511_000275 [Amanita phalloides]|nr:hypothetical protein APHAL10511_000275 [Amanita phalloides]
MGTILDPKYVTAILVQVKNDDSLTDVPSIAHFTMIPFHVGLFAKDDGKASGLPIVLRIVFALASKKAIVKAPSRAVPKHKSPHNPNSRKPIFTAFELWIAGVSPESFGESL